LLKRRFYSIWIIPFLFFAMQHGQAGVVFSIPDTLVCCGDRFSLPLMLEGVTGEDSLLSYQCVLSMDTTMIRLDGITSAGSMTQDWGYPFVNAMDGRQHIAAFAVDRPADPDHADRSALLWMSFESIMDTNCVTVIQIEDGRFFNLHGEIMVDSIGPGMVETLVNFPPEIQGLAPVSMPEDSSLTVRIGEHIRDGNDSLEILDVRIEIDSPYTMQIDSSDYTVFLEPPADWAGDGQLRVRVTDPFGLADSASVTISTKALPDPPGPFGLIAPADGAFLFGTGSGLDFEWQASENVDPDDQITYRISVGPDSTFQSPKTIPISGIQTTNVRIAVPLASGVYFWRVSARDNDGFDIPCNRMFRFEMEATGVRGDDNTSIPEAYQLYPNFPNPFNPSTTIRFALPRADHVRLMVINSRGEQVRELANRDFVAGYHEILWDGRDRSDRLVPSGIYVIRIQAGDFRSIRKMLLVK